MENLCLRLLYANSEQDVQAIIESDSDMRNPDNWHPLDSDTNYRIIGNQSSNGGKAATELVTNMVDAILTKECLKRDIDPKGDKAPSTMYDAVDKFIKNLQGGKISQVDDEKWLKKYAEENLIIGLTGGSKKPCYVFCDNGEGQSPDKFPKTFLSLRGRNKSKIPFVQGKYNMGSSGVLKYCANWFKLILSRRWDEKTPWGWTLIRKNSSKSGGEHYAEYFAPGGAQMIQMIDHNPICPLTNLQGEQIKEFSLKSGTIIKLYDYHVGKKNDYRKTRDMLNENLIETILPFRIYDCRQKKDKKRSDLRKHGVDERPFNGLEFQVLRPPNEESDPDDSEGLGRLQNIGVIDTASLGKISISVVVLEEEKRADWLSRNRIFHHLNGQVQHKQQRGDLGDYGLNALMDRIVIFIDASYLNDSARKDVWKTDREKIQETRLGDEYLDTVKNEIKNSPILKDLNHRIAREQIDAIAKDSSKEILKDLLSRDKNFAALLAGIFPDVPVRSKHPKEKKEEFRTDLVYSPSYIKLRGNPKVTLPINKNRPIICDTDAVDNFMQRPDNCGYIVFDNKEIRRKSLIDLTHNLNNGVLFLSVSSAESAFQVGDSIKFRIGLEDPAMPMAVYTEKEIEITFSEPEKKKAAKSPKPRPPKSEMLGIPERILVTEDGRHRKGNPTMKWEDVPVPNKDFNGQDGGYVRDFGEEEKMYYINYDNIYFQNSLRSARGAEKDRIAEKYISGMHIFLLGIESAIVSSEDDLRKEHSDNLADVQSSIRRMAAGGAAKVILTLTEALPKMFNKNDNIDGGG